MLPVITSENLTKNADALAPKVLKPPFPARGFRC